MNIIRKGQKLQKVLVHYVKQGISPAQIALAVALGALIAFIPMIGVHTLFAFFFAFVLRLNPLIVLLGTQLSNPLSFPFILFISAQTGHLILHGSLLKIEWSADVDWKNTYLIPTIIGSMILGLIVSVACYTGVYSILKRWKK